MAGERGALRVQLCVQADRQRIVPFKRTVLAWRRLNTALVSKGGEAVSWQCSECGESNDPQFDICWKCGTGADGTPPSEAFSVDAPAEPLGDTRGLVCLRCSAAMEFAGRKRFHEGSRAWPFLFGEIGELLVRRESFDLYACPSCGKIEFFLEPAPAD